ncbi:MAG: hypothetical protein M3Y60_13330 [Bacteroidota bacterium]|nr:hypothetical protein [Bacteroidota bacterium]
MNLETDNPEKGQLLQRSAHHREILEEEMKALTEKSEKILTNALIIGGALALTYFLVSGLSSSSKKRKTKARKVQLVTGKDDDDESDDATSQVEEPGIVAQIGSVLMAQATGLLLSIARDKLVEFLQSQAAKKDNSHERS